MACSISRCVSSDLSKCVDERKHCRRSSKESFGARLFPSLVQFLACYLRHESSRANVFARDLLRGRRLQTLATLPSVPDTVYSLALARHDISAAASLQTCAELHPTPAARHVESTTSHPLQVGSFDSKSSPSFRTEQSRRLTDTALLQRRRATQEWKQQWKHEIELGCPEPAEQQAEAQAGEEVSAVG